MSCVLQAVSSHLLADREPGNPRARKAFAKSSEKTRNHRKIEAWRCGDQAGTAFAVHEGQREGASAMFATIGYLLGLLSFTGLYVLARMLERA